MKSMIVVLSIVLALFAATISAEEAQSDVVVLTAENFKGQTAEGTWLVEFYAPWCGHCKSLAPTWEKLATQVKGEFKVGKVDCTVHKEVCSKFGVKGYPTLKMLKDGVYHDYAGHRTIEAFTAFVKEGYQKVASKSLPADLAAKEVKAAPVPIEEEKEAQPQVVVLTDSDFASQVKEGTWLVKFYAPWCGHCKSLAPVWDSLSTKTDGKFKVAKIDCTTNRATCGDFIVRGYPTLKLIKDGKAYTYSGARTEAAFLAFADGGYTGAASIPVPVKAAAATKEEKKEEKKEEAVPADQAKSVVVLTEANFDEQIASGEWFVEFYAPWCGHCKSLVPVWNSLAQQSKANIAKVDCTVEKKLMTRFGVRGFPTLKFIKDGKVYDYKGQRTVEAFTAFTNGGYATATSADLPKGAAAAAPAAGKDEL